MALYSELAEGGFTPTIYPATHSDIFAYISHIYSVDTSGEGIERRDEGLPVPAIATFEDVLAENVFVTTDCFTTDDIAVVVKSQELLRLGRPEPAPALGYALGRHVTRRYVIARTLAQGTLLHAELGLLDGSNSQLLDGARHKVAGVEKGELASYGLGYLKR